MRRIFLSFAAGLALLAGPALAVPRPLSFEENRGQTDPRVRFLARGDGYHLFLAADEAVVVPEGGTSPLRLRWLGSRSAPVFSGQGELPGRSNYLIGSDPARWRTGIRSWERVRVRELWPGIDLAFYGNPRQLEYDFLLAPRADPARIRIALEGAEGARLDAAGDLVLRTGGEEVRLRRPVAFQETGGVRRPVASGWWLADGALGVELGAYDRARPLVIDPVLTVSTYLGGRDEDQAFAVATDPQGNAYVTGQTRSPDFPARGLLSPFRGAEVFVTKLDPRGRLVYSTFLGGGNSGEDGYAIAADAAGHAYVTGHTSSGDFPLVNPLPLEFRENGQVFVSKLAPDGASLVYSTRIGSGLDFEVGWAIAVDPSGHAWVAGETLSNSFPTVGSLYEFRSDDAFVLKLSTSGSQLLFSTLLGGSGGDWAQGIALGPGGDVYVTGVTQSHDFPTLHAFQSAPVGSPPDTGVNAFVSRIDPDPPALVWSTYLGGSGAEEGKSIACAPDGTVWVAGWTSSTDFPTRNALQPGNAGAGDVFAARFGADGALLSSTYLGGGWQDEARGVAVDRTGGVHLTGFTTSPDFPLADPLQATCAPRTGTGACLSDAFVARLASGGTELAFSTFLGGDLSGPPFAPPQDQAQGIAVGPQGEAWIAGWTSSSDFPAVNAVQSSYGGWWYDAFVARIAPGNRPPDCATAAASPGRLWPPNGKLRPITIGGVTDPDGDSILLRVTSIRQDEPLSKKGQPDAFGIGTARPLLRADRAGGGDGRVYHLRFAAEDGQGGRCEGEVTVCVPHDPGRASCGDGGALVDSTDRKR